MRKTTARSVVRDLNDANILYCYDQDPSRPAHVNFPRYGVSGSTIYSKIVNDWFKGSAEATDWFLSWMFYSTIARKLCKKIIHLTVIIFFGIFLFNYFFTEFNIFGKIVVLVFGFLIGIVYYGFTSTPTKIFRESIKNFDSGFFDLDNKKIFFETFFLDLPAACYSLEEFIRLSGMSRERSIDTLNSLHREWFGSSRELINCVESLE